MNEKEQMMTYEKPEVLAVSKDDGGFSAGCASRSGGALCISCRCS